MGEPVWQSGNRLYLDTNLFIYAIEDISPFAEQVRPLLQAADRGEIQLVTSLLALAETLVMPYRGLFTQPPTGLRVSPLDAATGTCGRNAG